MDRRAGLSPRWDLLAMIFAACAVATVVIIGAPDPTAEDRNPPTTQTVGCTESTAVCRLIDLLEGAERDPDLTPRQREAIVEATAEVIGAPPTTTTSAAPRQTTTTTQPTPRPPATTTTTTTTTPRLSQDQLEDTIREDLLGDLPTIPGGADGDP